VDYYFLGDPELVTAFRFAGVSGEAVQNQSETLSAFRRITEGYNATAGAVLPGVELASLCRVLILTEEAADWLGEDLDNWQLGGRYPLVVEIPGITGRQPGRKTLVDSIREAIGVHV
jgi:V/A-type H+-transporting ATPase subunit F